MKISVIGAGNVGATTAQRLVERGYYEVVLHDIVSGLAQGKALDIYESSPIIERDLCIRGTSDYGDTAGSDLLIVTAGASRRPGMERNELLKINAGIIKEVVASVSRLSPQAIIIMVTNPVEAMTYLAMRISGWGRERVMGLSGVLDSARLASFIAAECGVPVSAVKTLVMGEHGSNMVPMTRLSTVGGRALTQALSEEKISNLVQKTVDAGAQILELLKTSSAYYAPAAALQRMAEAILLDSKEILPVSAYLDGEYGLRDCVLTVPAWLGERGVEKILELELNPEEKNALLVAAQGADQYKSLLGE